ncbi:MAG: TonB-dependent receptor, partial [Bacteroidetes bacterium]|nr:TonB-dependent receptor [Bacteroidota bacterium]
MTRLSFHETIEIVCALLVMLVMSAGIANAQTRGRIQGVVKDAKTGETLPGVNVIVVGTNLGAVTDLEGRYFVVNVPVGTYEVKASMIGYSPMLVKDVLVSLDRVATVDFSLQPSEIQTSEVVVVAQRNQLHQEVSGTQMVSTSSDIVNTAGVREINAFLAKLPGVSTTDNGFVTIRGGTADQVGTLVNGLSYDNAAVGNAETSIPLSAIEQVSVLSGGYSAEYGNFRSGLINITTKSGSQNAYHGTIDISGDQAHMRRFGQSLYDPTNAFLAPYLDPVVAFTGTQSGAWDQYQQDQHASFDGWIAEAQQYNQGKPLAQQASPLEL